MLNSKNLLSHQENFQRPQLVFKTTKQNITKLTASKCFVGAKLCELCCFLAWCFHLRLISCHSFGMVHLWFSNSMVLLTFCVLIQIITKFRVESETLAPGNSVLVILPIFRFVFWSSYCAVLCAWKLIVLSTPVSKDIFKNQP